MEELLNFEIKTYLVEELESEICKIAESGDGEFLRYWFDSVYGTNFFDRYMQGPLLSKYINYIYSKSKPLNQQEINKWLTLSINQFSSHKPELRREFLKNKLKIGISPRLAEMEDYFQSTPNFDAFFEPVYSSYENNFHLFYDATIQALDDFKRGFLVPLARITSEDFQAPKKKMKTNLSVPELAYLFKALVQEELFLPKKPKDTYEFVVENFSSKQQDVISINSVKNLYEDPNAKTLDSWQVNFAKLVDRVKKDKEK